MKDVSAGRSDNARKKKKKRQTQKLKMKDVSAGRSDNARKKEEKADPEAKNEGCVCRKK